MTRSLEERVERLEWLVEQLYAAIGDEEEDAREEEESAPSPDPARAPEPAAEQAHEPAPPEAPVPDPASADAPVRERAAAGATGAPAASAAPAAPVYSGVPLAAQSPGGVPAPPERSFDLTDLGENWIGRVGVGLFLLGLAFAFKYAFDQGWITPLFRVAIGVQIGALFLVMGLRLHQRRPLYSQVLLGGAIGTFYLTGWAAFQLYGLVGHGVAVSWMSAVTVLALALAETKDQSTLAAVGAFGGLITPFALHTGAGSVPELVGYTTLLLGWTAVIYLRRGWLGLLGVISAGGLLVMAVAADAATGGERWIAQGGVALAWVVAGVLPFVRQRLRLGDPERWPTPRMGFREQDGPGADADQTGYDRTFRVYLVVVGIGAGLMAGLVTVFLWELESVGTGLVLHAEALVFAAMAWWALDHRDLLASPAVETAAVLLVAGTVAFLAVPAVSWLDPELLYPALALEALLFLSLRREMGLGGVAWVAHLVFVSLAVAFAAEVSSAFGRSVPAAFDVPIPFRLTAVAAAFGAGFLVTRSAERTAYHLAAHVAFVLWIAAVLHPVTNGLAWTVLAWGVYGLALMAAHRELASEGLATLAHVLFALVALLFVSEALALFRPASLDPGLVPPGALLLLTLATALGAGFLNIREEARNAYLLAAHAGFLFWLAAVLYPLQDAVSWITLAWGAHGIVLLALSIRLEHRGLRATAFGTLALVVAKLILVDTAQMEMIWRVLLFMGFGAAFLALGYFLRSDEREAVVTDEPSEGAPAGEGARAARQRARVEAEAAVEADEPR